MASNTNTNTSGDSSNGDWKPEEVPQLTVDVYRKGDVIFIVSTVAGVSSQDLDISIDNNVLSIKGVRRKPYDSDEVDSLLSECFWGEFYRELTINEKIEIKDISASLNQGILVIQVPIMKVLTRKISVETPAA